MDASCMGVGGTKLEVDHIKKDLLNNGKQIGQSLLSDTHTHLQFMASISIYNNTLTSPRRGGGGRRRHEGEKKISKSTEDELVGIPRIESKIAEEKLVQHFPAGVKVHEHEVRTRLHHLLHGAPEVHIGVRREGGDGHAVGEEAVGVLRRGRGGLDDGVGVARGGEEEALGGKGGGQVSGFEFGGVEGVMIVQVLY